MSENVSPKSIDSPIAGKPKMTSASLARETTIRYDKHSLSMQKSMKKEIYKLR